MISPSNRLLLWLAVLLPFAAAGGLIPSAAGVAVALFAGLCLSAGIDAVRAGAATRGIEVTLPPVVRLSKNRPGEIPLRITNDGSRARDLQIGLPLPAHIHSAHDEMLVRVTHDSETSAVTWPCTPTLRGSFGMGGCSFRALSPWGFWYSRASTERDSEIRVYPDLFSERRRLAALFLRRGNFGVHRHRMVGQGHEFEKLRDYMPGDSYDDIHWKATAKRGRPVTKMYQIERTQEIYAVIDTSRLSARRAGSETELETFITSALVLGLAAKQQGDLFGLITFNDKVRRFIRAGGGVAHYNACRDALSTLNASLTTPDFGELCSFVRLRLRRRALLMILTDLDDPILSEGFLENIDLVCRHHLVLVSMLRPAGVGPLFGRRGVGETDGLYDKLAGHLIWQNLQELGRSLQHRGVHLSLARDAMLSTELVTQYMNVKARQAL